MSMFKNVKVYLGLGPDEEYEDRYLDDGYPSDDRLDGGADDDDFPVDNPAPRQGVGAGVGARNEAGPRPVGAPTRSGRPAPQPGPRPSTQPSAVGAVRPLRPVPSGAEVDDDGEVVVRRLDDGADELPVRPRAIQHTKPKTVSPQSFGDAKILADEFKRSVPVVMNIRDLDRDLSRRLIDFASGVCYSLGGAMEKLASGVFLLTPRGVEVGADDRRRLEERGFD